MNSAIGQLLRGGGGGGGGGEGWGGMLMAKAGSVEPLQPHWGGGV